MAMPLTPLKNPAKPHKIARIVTEAPVARMAAIIKDPAKMDARAKPWWSGVFKETRETNRITRAPAANAVRTTPLSWKDTPRIMLEIVFQPGICGKVEGELAERNCQQQPGTGGFENFQGMHCFGILTWHGIPFFPVYAASQKKAQKNSHGAHNSNGQIAVAECSRLFHIHQQGQEQRRHHCAGGVNGMQHGDIDMLALRIEKRQQRIAHGIQRRRSGAAEKI